MHTTTPRVALSVLLAAGRVLSGAGSAIAAPPADAGKPQATTLVPAEEMAPFVGVADTSGQADLRLTIGHGRICVDLTTSGFDLRLSNSHEGAAGPTVAASSTSPL